MTADELARTAAELGLDAVGATAAAPYEATEAHIRSRREAGLFGRMRFTMSRPEISCHPEKLLPGARTVVAAALCYWVGGPTEKPGEGLLPRYAWRDNYAELRQRLDQLGGRLGGAYRVFVDSNDHVDREAAVRAGIAFYGKNTMAITREHGSWVVLGALVTDVEVEPSEPMRAGCGTCTLCIDACPTGALDQPGVLDATRCLSYWTQTAEPMPDAVMDALGPRVYGCDICQDVCPWNRGVEKRRAALPLPDDAEATVTFEGWLGPDEGTLTVPLERLFVPRNDPRWLRRNALVSLGNNGTAVQLALAERYLADDDPVLAAAATRALARLRGQNGAVGDAAERDETLAMLAHEVRSPVAALDALSAAATTARGDDLTRILALARAAIADIVRLCETGETVALAPLERVALSELVAAVAGLAGARVVVGVVPTATVLGDATRLRQALANVLSNAARHAAEVRLEARVEHGSAVVEVRDDGPGVLEGLDVFARGVSDAGSTGYGLWLTRAILEAHGGTIALVRDGEPGACFRIELPLASAST